MPDRQMPCFCLPIIDIRTKYKALPSKDLCVVRRKGKREDGKTMTPGHQLKRNVGVIVPMDIA